MFALKYFPLDGAERKEVYVVLGTFEYRYNESLFILTRSSEWMCE